MREDHALFTDRAVTTRSPLPSLLAALLLPGCAADLSGYPSLAPRAAEREGFAEPAAPPPPPVVADPALDARIAAAERDAAAAQRRFDAAFTRAAAQVRAARGARAGSDAWLDAQTAVATLDTERADYRNAFAALEDLAAQRAQALEAPYPALDAAVERARAAAGEQTRRIDDLAGQLAQP